MPGVEETKGSFFPFFVLNGVVMSVDSPGRKMIIISSEDLCMKGSLASDRRRTFDITDTNGCLQFQLAFESLPSSSHWPSSLLSFWFTSLLDRFRLKEELANLC